MEQFWRNTGIQLGQTVEDGRGRDGRADRRAGARCDTIEFATGQDSYLNPDSQIAIDNVAFQDDFGGETIILLFSSEGDADVTELFEGDNLAELERLNDRDRPGSRGSPSSPRSPRSRTPPRSSAEGAGHRTVAALGRDADGRRRAPGRHRHLDRSSWSSPDHGRCIGEPALEPGAALRQHRLHRRRGQRSGPAGRRRTRQSANPFAARSRTSKAAPVNGTAVGGVVLQGNATLDELTAGTDKVARRSSTPHRSTASNSPSPARRSTSVRSTTTSRAACSPSAPPPSW